MRSRAAQSSWLWLIPREDLSSLIEAMRCFDNEYGLGDEDAEMLVDMQAEQEQRKAQQYEQRLHQALQDLHDAIGNAAEENHEVAASLDNCPAILQARVILHEEA